MLANEVFALECRKRYEEQGLIVDKRNGQFAHCPLPKGMGEEGVYLLWGDHQHQGLLQSRDVGRRCFWSADVKLWLDTFPEGFFELYEIYDEFMSGEHNPMYGRTGENNPMYGRTGENHPRFGIPHTEEWKKAQSEKMSGRFMGALNPRSKAIIAIKPGGEEVIFGGRNQAARELNIDRHTMLDYLNKGEELSAQSKYPGWQFLYA